MLIYIEFIFDAVFILLIMIKHERQTERLPPIPQLTKQSPVNLLSCS